MKHLFCKTNTTSSQSVQELTLLSTPLFSSYEGVKKGRQLLMRGRVRAQGMFQLGECHMLGSASCGGVLVHDRARLHGRAQRGLVSIHRNVSAERSEAQQCVKRSGTHETPKREQRGKLLEAVKRRSKAKTPRNEVTQVKRLLTKCQQCLTMNYLKRLLTKCQQSLVLLFTDA